MTTSIEQRFAELGETSSGGRLLRAQWEYDKRLITSALGTISNHFPHYSQHDASHSETILNRIASILGPKGIEALSVSDLWLLLESAFLHDAGMVVLDVEKRGDLASPEFAMFLRETLSGTDKEMAGLARRMLETSGPVSALSVHERHQLLIPLYAEYVRRRHAERAERAVLDPMTTLAAPSPRAWLIPNRLWRAIARISTAHGKDFEYALSLPHRELGLTTDYCHPRFVACMLRFGDLLDLDSGRFCPSVNAQMSRMPTTSVGHQRKHEGIEHFSVTPERIEVEAEYTDADAYFEAEKWFAWLREELTAQTLHWSEIAPSADFGRLPMAGKIQARLRNQILLGSNGRPRLEVDREKLLAIARGANIYEGEHDAAREIIQNAIDATLLRYSYDCQSEGQTCAPNPDALREALTIYPIDVSFEKDDRDPTNFPDRWVLRVKDRGIGMAKDDIARMLSVGSPKTSRARTKLLDWLPEWGRPSGSFGIGFNSLFQYCKEVRVITKHPRETEAYNIEFTKEAIEDDPRVVVTSESWSEAAVPRVAGTEVVAYFEIESNARHAHRRGYSRAKLQLIDNFDPLLDKELPIVPALVSEVGEEMSATSLCNVRVFAPVNVGSRSDKAMCRFFSPEENIELTLIEASLFKKGGTCRYRGAEVQEHELMFGDVLSFDVDVLCGNAPTFLNLSRRKWTDLGTQLVARKVKAVLPVAIEHWLKLDTLDAQFRKFIQLEAAISAGALAEPGDWRELEVFPGVSLQDLVASPCGVVVAIGGEFSVDKNADEFKVSIGQYQDILNYFLSSLLKSNFTCVERMTVKGRKTYKFSNKNSHMCDISREDYAEIVAAGNDWYGQGSAARRGLIACPDRFSNLRSSLDLPLMYWYDPYFDYYAVSPIRRTNVGDTPDSWAADHLDMYISRVAAGNGKSHAEVLAHLSDLFNELAQSEAWQNKTGLTYQDLKRELDAAQRKLALL